MYRNFTNNDTSTDIGIVTSGVWQDGASSITSFYTSSTRVITVTIVLVIKFLRIATQLSRTKMFAKL